MLLWVIISLYIMYNHGLSKTYFTKQANTRLSGMCKFQAIQISYIFWCVCVCVRVCLLICWKPFLWLTFHARILCKLYAANGESPPHTPNAVTLFSDKKTQVWGKLQRLEWSWVFLWVSILAPESVQQVSFSILLEFLNLSLINEVSSAVCEWLKVKKCSEFN